MAGSVVLCMRILTVSAHYPPNFVSGGTLQPQRISQGLRDLGHEVSVYAGWIGDRTPLESWNDYDETGMAIQWVVSSPWIGWSDERNWLNPEIGNHFRNHIEQLKPDIVHFHALQSLGAGLLPIAKSIGAQVVVTMHDFWWLCSRQFLVSPQLKPCSLVVEAGTCQCEVDIAWRSNRAAKLATLLESADLVLAPSASATRVLAANGVAPHRLHVDENGLPSEVVVRLRAPRQQNEATNKSDTVRFLYAGGPNVMKGAGVLVEAVNRISDSAAWHLSAYGLQAYLDTSGASVDHAVVDVIDSFDPDRLGDVLAAHDVLLLPSIMRETHSLLTREALAAGLPVICTDTLGPEEVITHGVNGLVIPAADPAALAGAIARLTNDPKVLSELQRGALDPVAARSLDEQVRGLDALFSRLIDDGPTTARSSQLRVLFIVGIDGAPLRYRARLPAEGLAHLGVPSEVRHYRDPELLALGSNATVIVFYRVPATIQVLDLIESFHRQGLVCIFDVDDLIFDPTISDEIPALRLLAPDEVTLWRQGIDRYRTTLEACDAFIGSTPMLVERAAKVTGLPAYHFANGVGIALARRSDVELKRPRKDGPLRIGYLSGTTTHDEDWFSIEPAVIEVLDQLPDVELWLGGHLPESDALKRFGARVIRLPFVSWLELPAILRDLDVNVSPLAPDSRFNEAKSAIKWLEAALCATPTIASPTLPFRDAISDGNTGLLASTHHQWTEALTRLLSDESERSRIGGLARRHALLEWAPALQGERYRVILEAALAAGPNPARTTESRWQPVALDEPSMPNQLESYPSADDSAEPLLNRDNGNLHLSISTATSDIVRGTLMTRIVRLYHKALSTLRSEGLAITVRKSQAKLRSRYGARP